MKKVIFVILLILAHCAPSADGTAPVAAITSGSSESASMRKSVDTLPPGSDANVVIPTSSTLPDTLNTAVVAAPVPLINSAVPVVESQIAPPALAPRAEVPAIEAAVSVAASVPAPVPVPPTPTPIVEEQSTGGSTSFIDQIFTPAPAPISIEPIANTPQQNPSDLVSQIIVPDSILIPEIVITPEVALQIVEQVQVVAPSEPAPVTETSVSSALAIFVGASETSVPVASEPTPTPVPIVEATATATSEPIAVAAISTATATSESSSFSTSTSSSVATSTATTTTANTSTSTTSSTATTSSTSASASISTATNTSTGTATTTASITPTTTSTSVSTSTATVTNTSVVNTIPTTLQSEITSDIAEKELNSSRCASYSVSLDTTDGVWYTTRTSGSISGIETYWSRQSLWANFRGVCKRGYYRVTIMAKNTEGNLPSSYKNFEVTARNATLGFGYKNKKVAGLIEIKANENSYHQGSTRVWLEPGDNKVELKWMNDYYVPFLYDANIQIKKVWLEPVVTTETVSMTRNGMQFCALETNGSEWRWYWKDDYIHTYWQNKWAEYCFDDLKTTRYKVSITARNLEGTLPLPSSYSEWKVQVYAGSNNVIFSIPANKDFRTNYSFIQVPSGVKRLRVVWLNDSYSAGVSDANIQIKNIVLEEAP